jgi:adenylate cyclase
MSEVFVSYARADESHSKRVASALQKQGFHVWRDDELPAHRSYAEVIQERLNSAEAVIVLWSGDAARSQWVRAEADVARNLDKLVQASIDGTVPPLPFNQIQCADLREWDGTTDTSGWRKLVGSVAELAGRATAGRQPAGRLAKQTVSICVLPFVNMSGDAEQEYFSDGISEDITTDLSKVSSLGVTARNTAFMFKGHAADVSEIAQRLGVSHVLEGSVRKAGNRVRITAQLIDGASGDHIWAERYDRDLTDIFAIQDELSKAIVDALKLKLLPAERKAIERRGTTDAQAYDVYLLARKYWITGDWGNTRQLELVIRLCRRALEIDPDYARAWGLLAIVQCILHFSFNGTDEDGMAAANRALSLDASNAEAHCVRARHLYEAGKPAPAAEELQIALELDPDSWEVNREAARIYYFERRFSEAVRCYEKAVTIDEADYYSWGMLCSTYQALENEQAAHRAADKALEGAKRVVASDPTNGAALGIGAFGLAVLGQRDALRQWIDRGLLTNPDNVFMRYNFACVTALNLKDYEAAVDLLEPILSGVTQSAYKATETDPDLDGIREHPRFRQLMADAAARLGIERSPRS